MASIWTEGSEGWQLLEPSGFPDEARLHTLIAEAPQVLPLSGRPNLVVLGTEIPLGSGYADIVAVEASGRPAVIEVKLAKNPESRRAVIAQVLAYASNVYGSTIDDLTSRVFKGLTKAGYTSIADAVQASDQDGSLDPIAFTRDLENCLSTGDIRLVLVLDSAPAELVGVVGYLGAIAPNLTLDLITVTAFHVGGQQVIVPQRIEPGRFEPTVQAVKPKVIGTNAATTYSIGAAEFEAAIEVSPEEQRDELRRLLAWAQKLEIAGVATLRTGRGSARWTLVPLVKGSDAGLVTIWNDHGPAVSPWRTAFERWAPETLARIESAEPPIVIGQGNALREVADVTLGLFEDAYREAGTNPTLPELEATTRAILIKQAPWTESVDPDTKRPGHGYRPGMTTEEMYQSVRAWWVLDPKRAEQYRYAVAVYAGVTRGVWEITPGSWKAWTPRDGRPLRWSFEATLAPRAVVEDFVGDRGKRIPKLRADGTNVFGQANPIAYWP